MGNDPNDLFGLEADPSIMLDLVAVLLVVLVAALVISAAIFWLLA